MAFTFDDDDLTVTTSPVVDSVDTEAPVVDSVDTSPPAAGTFTFDQEDVPTPTKRVRGAHGKQRLLDYEAEIYNQLGGSEQVDFKSTPTWGERFMYGIQDNPDEIILKFKKHYPRGDVKLLGTSRGAKLMYREDGSDGTEKWKQINPSGASIGDFSGVVPSVVTGAISAYFSGGMSFVPQLGMLFGGAFVGETGKQAFQTFDDTQTQSIGDQLTQSATTGAVEVLTGGLVHGGIKFLPYARTTVPIGEVAKLQNIESAIPGATTNPDINPMAQQIVGESNKRLQVQSQQHAALSPVIGEKETAQAQFATDTANEMIEGLKTSEVIQAKVTALAEQYATTESRAILGVTTPDVRETAKYFKQAIEEDFVKKSGAEVTGAYKKLDDIASKEVPEFDLTGVKNTAEEIQRGIRGDLDDTLTAGATTTDTTINISSSPQGRFDSILNRISKLDTTQNNYEVLKVLRTELNDLRANHAWDENFNTHLVKKVTNSLSKSLGAPTNHAPGYVKAFQKANGLAKTRFGLLENEQFRAMITSDTPAQIIEKLQKPGMLHGSVIDAIQQYATPEKVLKIRQGLKSNILMASDNPVRTLQNLEIGDAVMWKWLTGGTKEGAKELKDAAGKMKALYGAQWSTVARAQDDAIAALHMLESPSQTKQFLDRLGPEAKTLYREAVLRDVVEQSIVSDARHGVFKVDPDLLSGAMETYRKNGVLASVLKPKDIDKLNALNDYVQMTGAHPSDMGTSLVNAQLQGEMRKGLITGNIKKIWNAKGAYYYSTLMSKILVSDFGKTMFVKGLKGERRSARTGDVISWKAKTIGMFAGAVLKELGGDEARAQESLSDQRKKYRSIQGYKDGGVVHDYQLPTLNRPDYMDGMMQEGIQEALQTIQALREAGREQEAVAIERELEASMLLNKQNQGTYMQLPNESGEGYRQRAGGMLGAEMERTAEQGYAEGGLVTQDQMQGIMQQLSGVQPTAQARPIIPPLIDDVDAGNGIMLPDSGVMSVDTDAGYAPTMTKKQKEKAKVKAIKKGNKRQLTAPPPTTGILSGF
jgi:hypothetical protein